MRNLGWMIASIAVSMPTVVFAASHILPEGSLICDSAALFDQQVDLIARKSYQIVPGCGLSKSTLSVELVKTSMLGATEVFVPSAGVTIFVDRSALK